MRSLTFFQLPPFVPHVSQSHCTAPSSLNPVGQGAISTTPGVATSSGGSWYSDRYDRNLERVRYGRLRNVDALCDLLRKT